MKLGTKTRILDAAMNLLESKGIQSLTQPAVAKLVGIPQGQLTYHFRKRIDLVLAVTDLALDKVAETVFQKEFRDVADGRELGPFLKLLLTVIKSRSRCRALFGLVLEADESPEVRERLLQQGAKARRLIAVAAQLEENDPHVSMIHSLMLGYGVQYFLVDDKATRAQLDKDFEANFRALMQLHPTKAKKRRKK
jgi:AcrR family transcriptional regulator